MKNAILFAVRVKIPAVHVSFLYKDKFMLTWSYQNNEGASEVVIIEAYTFCRGENIIGVRNNLANRKNLC